MHEIETLILNPNIRKEWCAACNLLLLKDDTNVLAYSYAGSNRWYHHQCALNLQKAVAFTLIAYRYPACVIFEYRAVKELGSGV